MTRYTPLWQQAGVYPAAWDRQLLSTIWPVGGATGAVPTVVANTMNVTIPPGTIAVALAGTQGSVLCRWDANEVVTSLAAPPSGNSRIDVVVCQVRDPLLDSGANNDFIFLVVAGTPAASNPGVPNTPVNAIAVCQYTVVGASANLNGVTITDLRRGNGTVPTFWSTAERDAYMTTTPPDGSRCYITADQRDYRRVAGAWQTVPIVVAAFVGVTSDGAGNCAFTYARAFPAGTAPAVIVNCYSYANVSVTTSTATATGCTITLRRPSDNSVVPSVAVSVSYVATLM